MLGAEVKFTTRPEAVPILALSLGYTLVRLYPNKRHNSLAASAPYLRLKGTVGFPLNSLATARHDRAAVKLCEEQLGPGIFSMFRIAAAVPITWEPFLAIQTPPASKPWPSWTS